MLIESAHSVKVNDIRFTVAVREEATENHNDTITLLYVYLQDSSKNILPLLSESAQVDIINGVWDSIANREETGRYAI